MAPFAGPFAFKHANYLGAFLVANLPTNARCGNTAVATDCAAPFILGNPPNPGGNFPALVWFNGTVWNVVVF